MGARRTRSSAASSSRSSARRASASRASSPKRSAEIDARVVRGRCLPYGEGITYWPVIEVLKQLEDVAARRAGASGRCARCSARPIADDAAEEIAWAFRKLLEEQAPLVVVFDDIHWGEDTFLDLVERRRRCSPPGADPARLHRPAGAARPPAAWPVALRLEPLAERGRRASSSASVSRRDCGRGSARGRRQPALRRRSCSRWPGTADGDVEVPPNLSALLAARLDQLDTAERRVLERGAVEGEVFHRGSVTRRSTPEEPNSHAAPRRARPPRADPPRPGSAPGRGRLPLPPPPDPRRRLRRRSRRPTRADLHERFADWLERARCRARRAGRDRRLPPRAGRAISARARRAGRSARAARRQATRGCRHACAQSFGHSGRGEPPRTSARAAPLRRSGSVFCDFSWEPPCGRREAPASRLDRCSRARRSRPTSETTPPSWLFESRPLPHGCWPAAVGAAGARALAAEAARVLRATRRRRRSGARRVSWSPSSSTTTSTPLRDWRRRSGCLRTPGPRVWRGSRNRRSARPFRLTSGGQRPSRRWHACSPRSRAC